MNSVLLLLLLLPLWASCHRETVHICPNEEEAELECIPFSKCLNGTANCFSSNTVLIFQPGVYNIANDSGQHAVDVKNVVNLHLKGVQKRNNTSGTKIICHTGFSFMFTGALNLSLSGLAFIHCGAEIQLSVASQIYSFLDFRNTLRVALVFTNVTTLTIENVHVNKSNGVGLLAVNALGLNLTKSMFFGNNWDAAIYKFQLHEEKDWDEFVTKRVDFKGGNVVLLFTDTKFKCNSVYPRKRYTIDISNSTFAQGVHFDYYDLNTPEQHVLKPQYNFTNGGGLSVVLSQGTYDLDIMIQNITSFQNFAYLGANLHIFVYNLVKNSTITVANSSLSEGNALSPFQQLAYLTTASGLNYAYGFPSPSKFMFKERKELSTDVWFSINNVTFMKNIANFGAGLSIWDLNMGLKSLKCCHDVTIKNCTFTHNAALFGSAMYLYEDMPRLAEKIWPYRITLESTMFKNNELLYIGHLSHSYYLRSSKLQSTVIMDSQSHIIFRNCTFESNQMTALFAEGSSMTFKKMNIFSNNNGTLGGAIALYGDSIIYLMPDSHLHITDNHAKSMGGGIYITSIANFYITSTCFYQVEFGSKSDGIANQTALWPQVYMEGNTANIAGGTIYGGYVDNCIQIFVKDQDPLNTFHRVFNLPDVNLSAPQTEITSNPLGPCFCSADGEPQCSESEINQTVFTGEVFNISVIGVGQLNGTTPAVIVSRIFPDDHYEADSENDLHRSQYVQKLHNICRNITYHVHARKYAKILLHVEVLNYRYFTRTINVHIRDCPLGFRLANGTQPTCECEPQLQKHCNPDNGTITRSGTMWIGYFSNSTLFHKNCPFDYCKQEVLSIHLNESQKQCVLNRVGILCGKCREGLSLTLGTSQCKLCSNAFLGLLALFAFAGIMLVVVLYLCNLTVARGTINGLIFYANVIRINQAIFFPPTSTGSLTHVISQILTVFIAWLNLDLGIETCFYDGMNGYAKTWLQFVFPVYIWLLASFVIFASRYSSFLQKVSSNAVPVLATLFLLSYAKLQRTIITSLSCTWLDYKDRRDIVWLYDGNVQCFGGKHGLLALVAIAVAVFFILPVMLFLLFSRQLQARSTYFLLRWVNKLKPILDAYHGPYKDTYRHWTGVILFVQNVLFAGFACNVAGSANINCFIVAVIIVLLLPFGRKSGGIYKHTPKNILECFFHINLGILAATSLYIRSNDETNSQIYVSNAFIGTTFIIFIGILGFHTIQRVTELPQSEKVLTRVSQLPAIRKLCLLVGYERNSRQDPSEDSRQEEHLYEMVITPQTRQSLASSTSLSNPSFSEELREPLLEEFGS